MEELLARLRALLDTMPTDPTVRGMYDLVSAMEERCGTVKARLTCVDDHERLDELDRLLERA